MSYNITSDDIVYQKATQPPNVAEKPFIQKQWTNPIYDTNTSSNYSSNQIIFDTTILSNSGQLPNYQEGLISLPFSIQISDGAATNWTVGNSHPFTDFMIGIKNSHVNFLNSISINANNIDVVQGVPLSNAYLTFIQHSELSLDDEFLNSPLTGYSKDNSTSWYYQNATKADTALTGDSRGCGLGNNCNFGLVNAFDTNDTYNEGFLKRQKLISKYNAEKLSLMGAHDSAGNNGKSYVVNTAAGKFIYYDCYLRLKDICPNFFNNLPMCYGLKLKITLTINNNISFKFSKNLAGNFVYDYSTFSNPTSSTNPLMIAASYNTIKSQTGSNWLSTGLGSNSDVSTVGSYGFAINDATVNDSLVPCGSSCIPNISATVYTVQLKLGSITGLTLPKAQCQLHVPSYTLNAKYEQEYLSESNRYRKFYYTELEYQTFTARPGASFNAEISSSCVRPKRLILIPFLNPESNFGLNPISSPFSTEPSTTSPCMITNFNCSISNVNIYPNDITYAYDHYLQQLNGGTGVNANLMNGLASSRINLVDWQNNYGYIVCDLSRRSPNDDTLAVSIRVRGRVTSLKTVDIHAFIEREKWIEIDVITGDIRSRG